MRIIGIDLLAETSEQVRKNLKPDWYPLCSAFKTPIRDFEDYGKAESLERIDSSVYSMSNRWLPANVNVCAIVGMNGSGKSTFLEVIYRMINNLSYMLMKNREGAHNDLSYARGLFADLYYDLGGANRLCKIECRDESCRIFYGFGTKGTWIEKELDGEDEFIQNRFFPNIYKELFYTIAVNYSIYSLNKSDFDPYNPFEDYDNTINGDWLNGIFHKNDGYLAPITLAPFRKNGVIDIAREKHLANQRITALALLYYSKHQVFLNGYTPKRLMFAFNYEYEKHSRKKLYEDWGRSGWSKEELDAILDVITEYWEGTDEIKKLKQNIPTDSTAYKVVLYYLSCKTLKICATYSSFEVVYNPSNYKGMVSCQENKSKHLQDIKKAVAKMKRPDEATHITLKLRQCLRWIDAYDYSIYADEMEDGGSNYIKCSERFRKKHRLKTYDDAILHMPPSFFDFELRFYQYRTRKALKFLDEKKRDLSFRQMSSGEMQFLFSISYVLYHLKNLMSVKGDNYREEYNHVTIILDEAELYYHPQYQRDYLRMLLERIGNAHLDRRKLKSINIIIATHSPFILSDIQGQNVLYLKEGKKQPMELETFGANLYGLMKNSFFFEHNALGTIAAGYIKDILNKAYNGSYPDDKEEMLIGDDNIHRYLYYLKHKDDV